MIYIIFFIKNKKNKFSCNFQIFLGIMTLGDSYAYKHERTNNKNKKRI